jgi:hypothetical protein
MPFTVVHGITKEARGSIIVSWGGDRGYGLEMEIQSNVSFERSIRLL